MGHCNSPNSDRPASRNVSIKTCPSKTGAFYQSFVQWDSWISRRNALHVVGIDVEETTDPYTDFDDVRNCVEFILDEDASTRFAGLLLSSNYRAESLSIHVSRGWSHTL